MGVGGRGRGRVHAIVTPACCNDRHSYACLRACVLACVCVCVCAVCWVVPAGPQEKDVWFRAHVGGGILQMAQALMLTPTLQTSAASDRLLLSYPVSMGSSVPSAVSYGTGAGETPRPHCEPTHTPGTQVAAGPRKGVCPCVFLQHSR